MANSDFLGSVGLDVVNALHEEGPMTSTDLVDYLGRDRRGINSACKVLSGKGAILVEPGRPNRYSVTDVGLAMMGEAIRNGRIPGVTRREALREPRKVSLCWRGKSHRYEKEHTVSIDGVPYGHCTKEFRKDSVLEDWSLYLAPSAGVNPETRRLMRPLPGMSRVIAEQYMEAVLDSNWFAALTRAESALDKAKRSMQVFKKRRIAYQLKECHQRCWELRNLASGAVLD